MTSGRAAARVNDRLGAGCKQVFLSVFHQALGKSLELRQTNENPPWLRAFMRTDDLEIFKLPHQAHGTRMADRELGLQLRG